MLFRAKLLNQRVDLRNITERLQSSLQSSKILYNIFNYQAFEIIINFHEAFDNFYGKIKFHK